ncbi:hypothetical protein ACP70R_015732 [Stipagrostis hirtigluma subsp. patula]
MAAVHSAQKVKRAPPRSSKAKAASPAPAPTDEMAELQGMLERLRDEVIQKKKAEQEPPG